MSTLQDSRPASGMRFRLNIRTRTALFAWLVAIGTLLVFVVAIVPEQKRAFLENLRSRANGVTISLGDIAAGAVVNEDFSSVVDHCNEMLKGDASIDFIILARNDGFSLVHDHRGWRTDTLGTYWRPSSRTTSGSIDLVPLFERRVFHFSKPFDYTGIQWGWIHVGLSLESYDRSIRRVYERTALLALVSIALGLVASLFYANFLVKPIIALQAVVERVTGGDLRARAPIGSHDEIGRLAASVNSMTEAILLRDLTLKEANENLELRVAERTLELQQEVAARVRAHKELAEAQFRLLQLSRETGMAEVATGVLHNVGNVLNSVNVSANLVQEKLHMSQVPQLRRAVELLRENAADLPRYLKEHPQGRHLPIFLEQLAAHLEEENAALTAELAELGRNVEHIKEIVSMQQSFAKVAAIIEKVEPADLVDQVLAIYNASIESESIRLETTFADDLPSISTDKHRVLQILNNFLSNAIQATRSRPPEKREIKVQVECPSPHSIAFRVRDNGIGIPPENLSKLFTQGFTTRIDGHGFGLHSGAIAAQALGGSIDVESPGPNLGATFSLILPVEAKES